MTDQKGRVSEYSATCLIIHPELPIAASDKKAGFNPSIEEKLEEACGLAHAIQLDVLDCIGINLNKPNAGYLLGKGNCEMIADRIEELKPDVVIMNHTLSPAQQRNLEKAFNAKVIDRTGLILEIFGARAQTKEGKIQVELAALDYQRSRLIKSWSHLERQRGSTSFIGGPGETQLEIDRRLLGERIAQLKKELEQVRKNRDLQRRSREKVPFPIVALVGYTNAGKSTLFNRLTGAKVFAKDLLFATLDPTMRKVTLENGDDVIFADTVGFIADLPTHLVAAFRATLEQLKYADVILHVRDMARPDNEMQKYEVIETLAGLGIEYEADKRIIEVWNKLDAMNDDVAADTLRKAKFTDDVVAISALTGQGSDFLLESIESKLSEGKKQVCYHIPYQDGKAMAWLHENGVILSQNQENDEVAFDVEISPADIGRFGQRFSYWPDGFDPNDEDMMESLYG